MGKINNMIHHIKMVILLILSTTTALSLCSCDKKVENKVIPASFQLTTTPTGANLYVGDRKIGNTPFKKDKLNPGIKLLRLELDGYKTKWLKFKVRQGEAVVLNEKLDPITASVMITSKPSRATVTINGDIKGETPFVFHDLRFGEHKALITAHGYSPKTIVWNVDSPRPKRVNVNLNSNTGILDILSSPKGATIYIDNKPFGVTPGREELEEGEHTIRLEKIGYETYEQIIDMARGSTKKVGANLKIKPSSIKVITDPPDAKLFINGDVYSNTPTTIKNLTPGDYIIKVSKQGFDDEVREISLAPGQQAKVPITLETNLGGIDLVVLPPGVTIYLDNKKVGVSKDDGNGGSELFKLRGLTSGKHRLRFSHKRAVPQNIQTTVIVRKGEITRPKRVRMWIADTIMTLKNGRKLEGRLILKNDKQVVFSESPKITQGYRIEEVSKIEPLKYDE